jgi:hypothetical protein
MTTTNGYTDQGVLYPSGSVTWAELADSPYSTWTNWTSWNPSPTLPLTYTTNAVDFGRVDNINVNLELEYSGTLTLTLSHSTDDSSYTDVNIGASATISGIKARYVKFTLSLAGADSTVSKILCKLSNETQQETMSLTSTDLEGTNTAYELPLQKAYSKIVAITGTAEASGLYVADADSAGGLYVAADYTTAAKPLVLTVKNIDATDSAGSPAPTVAMYDFDGVAADGDFFCNVIGLPQMASDESKQIIIQS